MNERDDLLHAIRDHGWEAIDATETPCCFYCHRIINQDDIVEHKSDCLWLRTAALTDRLILSLSEQEAAELLTELKGYQPSGAVVDAMISACETFIDRARR